jgi:HEAT repeat protein
VLQALKKILLGKETELKETALNVVGVIGLPEAMEIIESVISCLEEKDSNVKAMAAWTIGKIGHHASQMAA